MKHKRRLRYPHHELLARLFEADVEYIMVGTQGFNLWVARAQDAVATLDTDLVVRRTAANYRKILRILADLKVEALAVRHRGNHAEHRALDLSSRAAIDREAKRLARERWNVAVPFPELYHTVEILAGVDGYTYDALREDAEEMTRGPVPVRVARPEKIVLSKRAAGRKKDKDFLDKYRAIIGDALAAAEARTKDASTKRRRRR